MLVRLLMGLVAGLLMMVPRPNPTPPGDGNGRRLPRPDHRPHAVPPTPPPGYDGDWPPQPDRPDAPPTPPPGFEGEWPPSNSGTTTWRDRIRDIIDRLESLLGPRHAYGLHEDDRAVDTRAGVQNLLYRVPAGTDGSESLEA